LLKLFAKDKVTTVVMSKLCLLFLTAVLLRPASSSWPSRAGALHHSRLLVLLMPSADEPYQNV
jgi:hypothetical protein